MASQSGYDDAGSGSFGILNSKLGSRDLPSKRLLGTGLASVGYETELNGKKCARKDFMGVPSGTFRREAARLVGLEDHINVVKTLDWTENNMSCSLVIEYMDDDLLGFLQKRKQSQGSLEVDPSSRKQPDLDSRNTIKLAPFELPEALNIMLQIARGMEYLADRGIRHGNLKTKNILVTRTSNRDRNSLLVKVADFGLVRTRRKSTSFASRQARKLDMARWTAPEILQVSLLEDKGETSSESDSDEDCTDLSDVADSDVPEWRELGTDVYSFAVTCSQILTGEDPYPNVNWKTLGVNILRHGLTPTLPAACPRVLRELLESCWGLDQFSRGPLKRPSFSQICKMLERLQKVDLAAQYSLQRLLPKKEPTDIKLWEPMLWVKPTVPPTVGHGLPPWMLEPMPGKEPTDIKRKGQLREPMPGKEPTDIKRKGQLREPMPGKEPTDIKRKGQLREPMPGKEPTDVVREIDLREPITVEDLWGSEWLQDPHFWEEPTMHEDQTLVACVVFLIMSTRTVVRHRVEWTQLREELELMLPDILRIQNRKFGCTKTWVYQDAELWRIKNDTHRWWEQLNFAVEDSLREVQQQDDASVNELTLLPVLSLLSSRRLSKLRNDINQLANQRFRVLQGLTLLLSRAPSVAKKSR